MADSASEAARNTSGNYFYICRFILKHFVFFGTLQCDHFNMKKSFKLLGIIMVFIQPCVCFPGKHATKSVVLNLPNGVTPYYSSSCRGGPPTVK